MSHMALINQISFLFFSFFIWICIYAWTTLCFCYKNKNICLAMIWSNQKRKLVSNQNFITLPWLLAGDGWVGWLLDLLYFLDCIKPLGTVFGLRIIKNIQLLFCHILKFFFLVVIYWLILLIIQVALILIFGIYHHFLRILRVSK